MKNYMFVLVLFGLIVSCGPSDRQEEKLKDLIAEWKNTSEKVADLSEQLGNQMYLLETKKEENGTTEMIPIRFQGEESNCETAYKTLREDIDEFIAVWKENSLKVDQLTNNMAIGKWTVEDDENLKALDLEVKERDVDIEQWLNQLEELKENCGINTDSSNS
ncbi:hypothetical protein [Algoriphagus halophilus]|uniref:Uncharacterized protein n=1 Tax=Algoriphagus halophilus TaxID=226505 RepID=A0A1N6FRN6_9BACT|nr:hypothetical protein [Algoriphagus halophilus]SIN97996.1 hypothetical protein SAMN05444394_2674 [Algoriphagus halophilus]